MDSKQLAQYIDHTALTAEKTEQDILKLCDEAIQYGFYSVCINSGYIPLAKEKLAGSDVKICTVVGFPLGANLSSVKAFETQEAIKAGAGEIDMVINVGLIKSNKWDAVKDDIQAVLTARHGVPFKVILETCLLTKEEIVKASGGIRDTQTALAMIEAGATRIGASAGIAIVTGVSDNTSSNY